MLEVIGEMLEVFRVSRMFKKIFGGKEVFGRWWVVVCGKTNLLSY
jgi:hypothetical protein